MKRIRKGKKAVVVVREDHRPTGLREKFIERIRDAMQIQGDEILHLDDDDYISALQEIADDIAGMIDGKREEIAAEEAE